MKTTTLTGIVISLLIFWTAVPGMAWDNRSSQRRHYSHGDGGDYRQYAHQRHKGHWKGGYGHRRGHARRIHKNCRPRPRKVVIHHYYHDGPVQKHYHRENNLRSGYFFATQFFEPGWGLIFTTRGRW